MLLIECRCTWSESYVIELRTSSRGYDDPDSRSIWDGLDY
jgi:hypothetical protein